MISPREALDLVLRDVRGLGAEQVVLTDACGRGLAVPIAATRDVPPFRNSAMDGYAVRAADVAAAAPQTPVTLRLLEVIGAGATPRHTVTAGAATNIMT